MAGQDDLDQDALAAEWGLALEEQGADPGAAAGMGGGGGGAGGGDDDMAAQWAAMVEDGGQFVQSAKGGAERILNQEEIDSLLGFSIGDITLNENSGIRAIIDSAMVSYERLPMLEIVFDRLVRLMTTWTRTITPRPASSRIALSTRSVKLPKVKASVGNSAGNGFGLAPSG